jgi:toxin-antitoxin system PIN domain toxin
MRGLLDVNVLIALLDADHSMHAMAIEWFRQNARRGWASCPLTQNGCVRVMSHPGYPQPLPVRAVTERLAEATSNALHEFWPDSVSLLDQAVIVRERLHGPRQITDAYLLALAVGNGGRFVTFDASIVREAVVGAEARHLVVL